MSFVDLADEHNMNILKKEIEDVGFTLEQIQDSSSARVAFTMHNIQKLMKTKYAYKDTRVKRAKRLF